MLNKESVLFNTREELYSLVLRKRRSRKEVGYINFSLFRYFFMKMPIKKLKFRVFSIFGRSLIIYKRFRDFKFKIYSGNKSRLFVIKDKLSGFRFGELLFTRRFGRGDLIHLRRKGKTKTKR